MKKSFLLISCLLTSGTEMGKPRTKSQDKKKARNIPKKARNITLICASFAALTAVAFCTLIGGKSAHKPNNNPSIDSNAENSSNISEQNINVGAETDDSGNGNLKGKNMSAESNGNHGLQPPKPVTSNSIKDSGDNVAKGQELVGDNHEPVRLDGPQGLNLNAVLPATSKSGKGLPPTKLGERLPPTKLGERLPPTKLGERLPATSTPTTFTTSQTAAVGALRVTTSGNKPPSKGRGKFTTSQTAAVGALRVTTSGNKPPSKGRGKFNLKSRKRFPATVPQPASPERDSFTSTSTISLDQIVDDNKDTPFFTKEHFNAHVQKLSDSNNNRITFAAARDTITSYQSFCDQTFNANKLKILSNLLAYGCLALMYQCYSSKSHVWSVLTSNDRRFLDSFFAKDNAFYGALTKAIQYEEHDFALERLVYWSMRTKDMESLKQTMHALEIKTTDNLLESMLSFIQTSTLLPAISWENAVFHQIKNTLAEIFKEYNPANKSEYIGLITKSITEQVLSWSIKGKGVRRAIELSTDLDDRVNELMDAIKSVPVTTQAQPYIINVLQKLATLKDVNLAAAGFCDIAIDVSFGSEHLSPNKTFTDQLKEECTSCLRNKDGINTCIYLIEILPKFNQTSKRSDKMDLLRECTKLLKDRSDCSGFLQYFAMEWALLWAEMAQLTSITDQIVEWCNENNQASVIELINTIPSTVSQGERYPNACMKALANNPQLCTEKVMTALTSKWKKDWKGEYKNYGTVFVVDTDYIDIQMNQWIKDKNTASILTFMNTIQDMTKANCDSYYSMAEYIKKCLNDLSGKIDCENITYFFGTAWGRCWGADLKGKKDKYADMFVNKILEQIETWSKTPEDCKKVVKLINAITFPTDVHSSSKTTAEYIKKCLNDLQANGIDEGHITFALGTAWTNCLIDHLKSKEDKYIHTFPDSIKQQITDWSKTLTDCKKVVKVVNAIEFPQDIHSSSKTTVEYIKKCLNGLQANKIDAPCITGALGAAWVSCLRDHLQSKKDKYTDIFSSMSTQIKRWSEKWPLNPIDRKKVLELMEIIKLPENDAKNDASKMENYIKECLKDLCGKQNYFGKNIIDSFAKVWHDCWKQQFFVNNRGFFGWLTKKKIYYYDAIFPNNELWTKINEICTKDDACYKVYALIDKISEAVNIYNVNAVEFIQQCKTHRESFANIVLEFEA